MKELVIFFTIVSPWVLCLWLGYLWGQNDLFKKYFKRDKA